MEPSRPTWSSRAVASSTSREAPSFIDGHIHPESSDLAIRPFAEAVLKHGTTSIMTDLHEVGVVSGLPGIEAVLEENEITDLNLYFVVPSHVPSCAFPRRCSSRRRRPPRWFGC